MSGGNDFKDFVSRRHRRYQKRVSKEANKYHDALMLSFLKKVQKLNDTEGKEVTFHFNKLDNSWKEYVNKKKIIDCNDLFADNVAKMIKQIEKSAKVQIPQADAKVD